MKSTDPSIVRHVIRDIHEVALLGSEYHYAFLLNTCFHQASPATLDTTVQRFGGKLAGCSLRSFLTHVTPEQLDSVSDLLLSKLSSDFLDRALDKRLATIRARSLVNALAKAERLGYDARDVVVEGRNGSEHVIPHSKPNLAQNPAQRRQSYHNHSPPSHQLDMNEPRIVPPANQSYQSITAQNLLYCGICGRPCSGAHALRYHKLKRNCDHLEKYDRITRDICAHCGTVFSNASGLVYHTKSQVCGNYSQEDVGAILPWLVKFYRERDASASMPAISAHQHMSPSASQRPGHSSFTSINAGSNALPTGHAAAKLSDAYAHLSAEDRASFDAAMKQAEDKYSDEMKRVLANNDFSMAERDLELAKLKNRFNTKQSITRKKYGIRLRERRPKHEIEAERNRILSSSTTWSPSSSSQQPSQDPTTGEPASKRPRMSIGGPPSGTYHRVTSDLPRRVTIGEMGGLGNSAGTAEHVDPTASSSATTTRPPYQYQSASGPLPHGATPATTTATTNTMMPSEPTVSQEAAVADAPSGTANDPMEVDDDDDDDDSDSDGDSESDSEADGDDDIPPVLQQS
ncbi:hypothetical protein E4U42_002921 [Claviceps africana]|uniref:Uncharacterized protein n=1 Tax=Claviceps africana TaxID=83212 RepID=A0A8K0NI92_9HYPO|nr:hypothetical protein E4U42_002921 [Claviceps africana]